MAGRKIARQGDPTSHGAAIIDANQGGGGPVLCEGALVAVDGAVVASHYSDPPHTSSPKILQNLSASIKVHGKLIVLEGSTAVCGAEVQPASAKSFGS